MAAAPIDPPLVMYSVLPLSLFTFKLAKLVHLYQVSVGANVRQTLAAAIAGLALTHTIGHRRRSRGCLPRGEPFFRTPKGGTQRACGSALAAAREETLMMAGLLAVGLGGARAAACRRHAGPDRMAWVIVLLMQSVPYASSLIVSLDECLPAAGAPARHHATAP